MIENFQIKNGISRLNSMINKSSFSQNEETFKIIFKYGYNIIKLLKQGNSIDREYAGNLLSKLIKYGKKFNFTDVEIKNFIYKSK